MTASIYRVSAKRWAHGWELHIYDGAIKVGVTQSRTLGTAEKMVREYIALDLDLDDENSFAVEITPQLDEPLATATEAAKRAVRDAERAQRKAAQQQREVARNLKAFGLSGADVASVLGVSAQRVSQLVNS